MAHTSNPHLDQLLHALTGGDQATEDRMIAAIVGVLTVLDPERARATPLLTRREEPRQVHVIVEPDGHWWEPATGAVGATNDSCMAWLRQRCRSLTDVHFEFRDWKAEPRNAAVQPKPE